MSLSDSCDYLLNQSSDKYYIPFYEYNIEQDILEEDFGFSVPKSSTDWALRIITRCGRSFLFNKKSESILFSEDIFSESGVYLGVKLSLKVSSKLTKRLLKFSGCKIVFENQGKPYFWQNLNPDLSFM
jgi:hypothetical protein